MPANSSLQETGRRQEGGVDIIEMTWRTVDRGISTGRFDSTLRGRTGGSPVTARR